MNRSWSRRHFIQAGLFTAGIVTFNPGPGLSKADASSEISPAPSGGSGQKLMDWQEKIMLALQHEHGIVIQYTNHCGKLHAQGLVDQAQILEHIIHDEITHARNLIHILSSAGLEPTLAVWPPKTDQQTRVMLTQDLAAEQGAIALYQEILKNDLPANAREKVHRAMEQEKSHEKLLSNLIQNL
ncbi:MAG: ferritin-like domain-containing protein [Desulfovermiculus sp.]